MAVIKKKGNKSLPPISTASLPDVIFMILFFFILCLLLYDLFNFLYHLLISIVSGNSPVKRD